MKTIFSGIQPTAGDIHIGNYLGAIKQWVDLQENKCIFSVVDLHALTSTYDIPSFLENTYDKIKAYIACGIDPEKSIVFIQSHVKEHTELAWILSTVTSYGDLTRMTQFKDKSEKNPKNINAGLFTYPILMAADILLYNTNIVPIGDDQKQHLEIAREIAKRFNNRFGDVLTIPDEYVPKVGARIMSLTEPTKKMSKSDSPSSYIGLFDTEDIIRKKIMSSTTDSDSIIKFDPHQKPGVSNLLQIFGAFSNKEVSELENHFKDKSYKDLKTELADLLVEKLKPIQDRKEKISNQDVEKIVKDGKERAELIAQETMEKVKEAINI